MVMFSIGGSHPDSAHCGDRISSLGNAGSTVVDRTRLSGLTIELTACFTASLTKKTVTVEDSQC